MPRVFLSHSHQDKAFVRTIATDLKEHGVGVWLDEAEIHVGDSLIQKIGKAVCDVEYVAACLSPVSVKSNWVTRELEIAIAQEIQGKRVAVLPILLPGFEDSMMPPFLVGRCYADLRDPERYLCEFGKLLARVKPCAGQGSGAIAMDANAAKWFIAVAKRHGMQKAVVHFLAQAIDSRIDPTERYWIYVALGEMGGAKAKSLLKRGLADENEFAHRGAEAALRRTNSSWRPLVGFLAVLLVGALIILSWSYREKHPSFQRSDPQESRIPSHPPDSRSNNVPVTSQLTNPGLSSE